MSGGVVTIDCGYLHPEFAAAYLITEGDRAAFIDNNTRFAVPRLLDALAGAGRKPEEVEYIIVTHVHLDHAGGTAELARLCPNAIVLAHPRAARHIIDPSRLVAGSRAVYGDETFARRYGDIEPVDATRVRSMDDGAEIALGARALRFIHTAGHAKHHMCIYDAGSNAVFTGDAFGLAYPVLQTGNEPFVFPSTSPSDFDPAEARDSIERIAGTGASVAYPTHYGAVPHVARVRDMMLRSLDVMEVMLAEAIASGLDDDELERFCYRPMERFFRTELERRGIVFSQSMQEYLADDIALNAQGIAVVALRLRGVIL
ncbi:MAG TPA: MBL fold metallo-hydrolase [Spirochaetota bacterium]|nr:MBL fold metallo-hydrolase [Spirochaetota bacterium]HNT09553.1 MBL fold metallo-hydrolase [Spirochaetota bacterium]